MILLLPFLLLAPPSADEIMQRVAENQGRALAARSEYVYDMNVFVRLKRANGKLAREESRDYVVTPGEKGAKRELLKSKGTSSRATAQSTTPMPVTEPGTATSTAPSPIPSHARS